MSTLNTYNLKSPDSANTNIALDASGNIAVRAGSAASPSIYITGDTNTGLYSPGADQVAISTNSTGRLFVDASGQVGIGRTPAASVALAVQGVKGITSLTSSTGTNATYHLFNNTGGNFYIGLDSSTGSDFGTTYAGVIWHGGAYPLVFANGNTERMRLDSSGRLGLGTSSPNTKLSVIGTTGAFADSSIRINGTAGTQSNNSGLWITGNQTTSHHNWLIGSQYNVNNAFEITPSTTVDGATFSTPAVVVTSAGRVGVGITSPSSLTHILQGTGGSDTLWAENGTSNNVIRLKAASASDNYVDSYTATSAGNLIIRPGGTETFRIDTAGRVLVGTSSSSDSTAMVLAGYNGGGSNLPAVLWMKRTENASTITADESLGLIRFGSSDSGYGASIDTYADATWSSTSDCPTRLVFSTTADGASSPTERMRITNSGYLKASNSGSYYAVNNPYHEFLGAGANDLVTHFENTTATGPYGIRIRFSGASPNNSTNYFLQCIDSSTTIRTEIRSNGGLANFQANNVNLSDRNAKKDITPAPGTWDCIKEWEIVNYRYKDQPDDADLNLGVIAQQVAESCPEVVTVFEEAKDNQPEKLGVKEQQMYWMAIKALQEAQLRIEQLEQTQDRLLQILNDNGLMP